MSPLPIESEPMPSEMRRALSDAVDHLTRSREMPRIEPRPSSPGPRRRVVLSRKSKQRMMSLLKHAAHCASGRAPKGNSISAVFSWLRELHLDGGATSLNEALTEGWTRLDTDRPPAGSIVVLAGAAAVKGFGHRFYADGELEQLTGDVLGIYAPR